MGLEYFMGKEKATLKPLILGTNDKDGRAGGRARPGGIQYAGRPRDLGEGERSSAVQV